MPACVAQTATFDEVLFICFSNLVDMNQLSFLLPLIWVDLVPGLPHLEET